MSDHDDDEEDPFDWEVRDKSTPFVQHAIAGSCAGVVEHVSMFPLDTVKTHMQASKVRLGMYEAAAGLVRANGVMGLMRGSTVIGAGCIPAHIGFFGAYELAVERLVQDQPDEHPMRMAACGGIATAVHDCVLTPHDVMKQRLQLGRHTGTLDCILSMWRSEGALGFYRSLPVTLAMNIPYTGLLVVCNDSLQKVLGICRGGSVEAELRYAHWYFLCAGISGAIASAFTTPLDVVKTKLQTQEAHNRSSVRSILAQSGWRGLFVGMGPRVLLAAPAAAVSWGTYETVRTVLSRAAATKGASSTAADRNDSQSPQARGSGGTEKSRVVVNSNSNVPQPLLS